MSAKFTEYKGLNLPKVADEVLAFWKENNVFEKSVTTREGATPYVFFEGPPSANGLPGVHHVLARAIKDIFPRYKTMKGFQVKRKAGWDTHGLPVELGVEKELGITKEDIGKKITVEEYNEACKKAVMRYTDIWNDLTEKMGYWVDTEDPYITYKSKYMETVWWLLKQVYNKNLLYKGYSIQPYSPKAGTGLSANELNQPGCYRDVTDTTVVAQFKITYEGDNSLAKELADGQTYFLAWTTTPWTLPSNTALTVGKKIAYVLVETYNQYTFEPVKVILAKALVGKQFSGKFYEVGGDTAFAKADLETYKAGDKKIPYAVTREFKGTDLLELRYEQLFDFVQPHDNPQDAFRVIAGDFVTTEDGTGIVHTAPTFGADDAMVAKQASPEVPPLLIKDENDNLVPLVDLQGRFRPEMKEFGNKYIKNEYYTDGEAPEKSMDVELAIRLKEENKAFKVEKYVHSYPHCWRTDKPVLYYPLDSWFIRVNDFKDRMHELNLGINWKPKSTGEGRFGNWLANANDWNLSRSRFWGIPLPIWRTEDGKEEMIIGSVKELKEEIKKAIDAGVMQNDPFEGFVVDDMSEANYELVDLHKNVVDRIVLVSPSGQAMNRESDLIDVWFDSGSMPYAQWHYPFENKELVEETWRKADFIAEGVDQTRGWFYTLLAISTMIFDDVAYKNVVSNGLVLDKNGQKMSKRLGNAVDPFTTLSKYGPDATRWYMISNANPWDNLKFSWEKPDVDKGEDFEEFSPGIEEVKRKFFGTLYNTYGFFALYANLDNFTYAEAEIPLTDRPEIDRWVLSELHTLIAKVDVFYAEYEPTKATRAIDTFVQENLSNWFVRLSRRRFWKGSYGTDKISAYQTLYTCLIEVAKLAAPVAPFFMERLYKDLNAITGKEKFDSIHLSHFPKSDTNYVDSALEHKMEKAQTASSLVLSLRAKEKIKVRQPLQRIMIPVLSETDKEEILAVADLIKSEVNVKEIELISDDSGILVKQIKPNFKVLGPRFGKDMKLIASAIRDFGADEIAKVERDGKIEIEINGKMTTLESGDVEISSQDIDGWLVASQNGMTVALDITITEELRKEGVARELVNRIQNLRKDSGYEVTDRIHIVLQKESLIEQTVKDNAAYIKTETLADSLEIVEKVTDGLEISFDNITTYLTISK
ncbi:isoleucine--tRNA ligase [uncultured Dokdonia sp.]|uniref:isoleucine--tRNA ligase n=1 Tax=uncultured Dokdonia sp. TaxID=575653 RepID=UPI00261BA727|nr:isoleucine--tRNA ligase [uncultured Dokdonia sp.]